MIIRRSDTINTPHIFVAGAAVRGSFHQRLRSVLQSEGGDVSLFEWATSEETPSQEVLQDLHRRPITLFTVAPPDVAQETIPKIMRAGLSLMIYNPARLVLGVPEDPTTDEPWNDDFGFLTPWSMGWPGSSKEVIEQVLDLTALRPPALRAPVAPARRLCLGQALLSQQRFEEAVAWLRPLLQESSPPDGTRAALAYGYAHLERWSECVEMSQAALAHQDGLTAPFYCLGIGLNGLGHYEAALGSFGRALSTHPELSGAWVGRGKALLYLGRTKEAVQAFGRGLAALADPTWNAWAYEDAVVNTEARHLLDQAQHDLGLQNSSREDVV